jgi:hypothetical protein
MHVLSSDFQTVSHCSSTSTHATQQASGAHGAHHTAGRRLTAVSSAALHHNVRLYARAPHLASGVPRCSELLRHSAFLLPSLSVSAARRELQMQQSPAYVPRM